MKSRSLHLPRPVSASGVRFAVKLTPHGPDHAVFVPDETIIHGPSGSTGAGGILSDSGWPESMRVMSGSGPFGPILNGVWQSMHAEVDTRYLPRATLVSITGGWDLSCASAAGARAQAASTAAMRVFVFIAVSPWK